MFVYWRILSRIIRGIASIVGKNTPRTSPMPLR